MKCAKCGGKMVKGARFDSTYGTSLREAWVPEDYFGEKTYRYDFMALELKKVIKWMDSYCCEKCGYVESYIRKEPK